jgi:hypothetical protein
MVIETTAERIFRRMTARYTDNDRRPDHPRLRPAFALWILTDSVGYSRRELLSAAAQLFALRSVHKNMVGNRIPGVMNTDEQ